MPIEAGAGTCHGHDAAPSRLWGGLGRGLIVPRRLDVHAFPIRIPAAKTSEPPSTTCSTARQNGVAM